MFLGIKSVYRVHAGVREWWNAVKEPWDYFKSHVQRILAGGDKVVTVVRFEPVGKESGAKVELPFFTNVAVTPGVPGPPPNPPGVCQQSAFSDPSSEPTPNKLTPLPGPLHAGGFKDEPGDEPANVANKLSYTLNLSQCVGSPWTVGELRRFHFVVTPPNGGGVAQQIVQFRRQ